MATTRTKSSDLIGDLLVREGLISEDQLKRALQEQRSNGHRLGYTLVEMGFVSETDLTRVLARKYRVKAVDLSRIGNIDKRVINLVKPEIATRHLVLPLRRVGRTLTVAMANPTNLDAIDELRFSTGYDIEPVVAGEYSLRKSVEKHYERLEDGLKEILKELDDEDIEVVEGHMEEDEISVTALQAQVEEAPVVKLINGILTSAVQKGASDVHIEPYEKEMRVRFRVDGALREIMRPPMRMKAALTSRVKILADLNIAERRIPQDGRIKMRMGKRVIDFRVSTLPGLFGEKIVLRILDKSNLQLDLEKFGMEPKAEQDFMHAIKNPYGMVLVTGPTGSGKTTTLYSALTKINTEEVNIMTAEDPVEYNLRGINQTQVRPEIGLTFAAALRAFLRQDPNIILVGEIRDLETAGIAIKAALTGHLVLSTLHTNDAASTITRLVDIGVEPFNVASAVNLVTAQRLVRRICSSCRREFQYDSNMLEASLISQDKLTQMKFYKGEGCDACDGTGYRGRQGLYEVMVITPTIRRMIMHGEGADAMKEQAVSEGMLTLRDDGLIKINKGITTLEEVLKETAA
ncbi:MAG: type IV-A pilus assembly ATPase PilB [Gemmatimonadetes bacterium]|uniref:protein-secreting ATPase n=1 Tax=Candidatus Kutchimonas denitrificans TaxID=3056748 RepID=A0AAE4Z960_9BACT|nr:type IV-A pilus assembly ATPase PilB [Gemmatimonadota bacterium]NIR73781.1 type IV-A pilus assembly ATPase PilB [Candidatus Kutchimonas denitrificans]NIS03145.1 type IV-A pilus assembly ATPase PilB [Gemmatimonadota bacterium]NIT69046.1 type IV-A pilus assembly ATPase PilB [Gemmatimonadota bacterium]NIU54137.1 type IV-A pilus assembly ATPase PilB [Gemmatimonadota bacterium]